jgi:hypothetical protein
MAQVTKADGPHAVLSPAQIVDLWEAGFTVIPRNLFGRDVYAVADAIKRPGMAQQWGDVSKFMEYLSQGWKPVKNLDWPGLFQPYREYGDGPDDNVEIDGLMLMQQPQHKVEAAHAANHAAAGAIEERSATQIEQEWMSNWVKQRAALEIGTMEYVGHIVKLVEFVRPPKEPYQMDPRSAEIAAIANEDRLRRKKQTPEEVTAELIAEGFFVETEFGNLPKMGEVDIRSRKSNEILRDVNGVPTIDTTVGIPRDMTPYIGVILNERDRLCDEYSQGGGGQFIDAYAAAIEANPQAEKWPLLRSIVLPTAIENVRAQLKQGGSNADDTTQATDSGSSAADRPDGCADDAAGGSGRDAAVDDGGSTTGGSSDGTAPRAPTGVGAPADEPRSGA